MISIIICSIDKKMLEAVTANIRDTIGVPWELVVIDNNVEDMSIAAAYNQGARIAKHDILCFVHEDISFHTKNWGFELCSTLNESSIGLVGACGAILKPNIPTSWSAVPDRYYRSNLIQRMNNGNKRLGIRRDNDNERLSEVVVADGFFLTTQRNVWEQFPFDESNFKGFHFYDQDFSLQISRHYKAVINHNILIEHFSTGKKNREWIKYSRVFYKKWKNILPVSLLKLSSSNMRKANSHALSSYIHNHLINGVYSTYLLRSLFQLLMLQPFSRISYAFLYQWLVRKNLN